MAEAEARLDDAARQVEVITPIAMNIPPSGIPSGAQLLSMEDVTVELPDRRIGPWTLGISGPERIAIRGPNGSGKSTLLKLAAGVIAPSSGTVRRAESRIAMLDQHVGLLDPSPTLLANIRRRVCAQWHGTRLDATHKEEGEAAWPSYVLWISHR